MIMATTIIAHYLFNGILAGIPLKAGQKRRHNYDIHSDTIDNMLPRIVRIDIALGSSHGSTGSIEMGYYNGCGAQR